MTIQEARVKGRKLHSALHRLKIQFEKKQIQLKKALRDLQKVCPHDLGRDENGIQVCAACRKEFE